AYTACLHSVCILFSVYCLHCVFPLPSTLFLFFFTAPPPTEIYTLSLHDALPISSGVPANSRASSARRIRSRCGEPTERLSIMRRSEEHTSELQSPCNLVCRLLLEKKKKIKNQKYQVLSYITYSHASNVTNCRTAS